MNTLSRAITSTFITPDERLALIDLWKSTLHRSRLGPAQSLLYQALLGRDWRRSFTPITNATKLANGAYHNWQFWYAYDQIRALSPLRERPRLFTDDQWQRTMEQRERRRAAFLAPFAGTVTPEMLDAMLAILPALHRSRLGPAQFAPGNWPFDAYVATDLTLGALAHAG